MTQPRNSNGRFAKRSLFGFMFVITAVTAFYAFNTGFSGWYKNETSYIATPVAYASITMESKVEALKESILDRLAKCESGGKKEEDGIVHLDSNDVGSYGAFQWQRKSVIHYSELRGNKINGRDAIILALTPDKARDLAKYVIFETSSGVVNDWTNCSKKLGLQAEVDVIKKLTN